MLSWTSSTDSVGVTGYEVWRSVGTNAFSKIADVATTSYTNTGLSASTTYNYYVKAKDAAGNISTQSNTATITTPAPDTPPSVTIINPLDGTKLTATTPLTSSATDDKGVTKVEYFIDGVLVGSVLTSPYSYNLDITKYTNGNHTIYARATDTIGQTALSSTITVNVQNSDTIAPTNPTNLSATATAYNNVNLTWTASTDNVGVNVYYVVRDGVTIKQLPGTSTSFSDSTANASTTYNYYVIAQDAVGNTSANSNTAVVTTPAVPDTTPPTAPTNLSAQVASSTQINLSWIASTDNVGIASYDVYRGSSKIANVSSTSFGDTNLSPGSTYTYYVVAIDTSNNRSANSTQQSATTPSQATTAGILSGRITKSSDGTAIGQAFVSVLNSSGNKLFQARTNSSGYYTITSIPQGTYTVRFTKNKFNDLSVLQTIKGGITQILNAILVAK